ncbi:MAG: cytochrome P450 [Sandaracinaceae bacterium]|nr:cytochrome P450 [Sandaracinaceae bacterium]
MSLSTVIAEQAGLFGRHVRPRERERAGHASALPPGPPWPPALQLYMWLRRPFELMRYGRARYGTPFTLKLPRLESIVVFDDPESIKDIFTGSSDTMYAGRANEPLRPLLGEGSLLLLDGPRHLRERKLLLPPFHGARMHRYGAEMRDLTARALERWPLDRPHGAHQVTQSITLDVILRTVFGVEEGSRMDALRDAIVELTEAYSTPTVLVPALQVDLGPRSPWGRCVRSRAKSDALLLEQIEDRRAHGGGDDVLSLMLAARYEDGSAMTDGELRDELVTLLAAGHETTATALAWTLWLLAENPSVLAKVHEELDRVVGATTLDPEVSLPYLDAVCKESLRLRPVVMAVGRVLQAPERVRGIEYPAGVMLSPNIYLTHLNPAVWRDPERFDPARFLEAKPTPYEFLPFGGGVRRCLGMAFALYEMRIILATILANRSVRPAPGVRVHPERRNVTMTPSGGMPLVLSRRTPT